MISFKSFLKEAASIENILSKIQGAQTEDGLAEFEKYYNKRKSEVEVGESDDITVRDALKGRRDEIAAAKKDALGENTEEV